MGRRFTGLLAATIATFCFSFHQSANAQGEYRVEENGAANQKASGPAPSTGRFARIEYVSGNVTWRANADASWAPAKQYIAIKPGAQIWAVGEAKAEVRFEDGAIVRIGRGAVATIDTLYNDNQGSFTRIAFSSGSGMLVSKADNAVYQLDLPLVSAVSSGPSRLHVSAENKSFVYVRSGKAVVQGTIGKLNLKRGEAVSVAAADVAYTVRIPASLDGWDRWNDERDHIGSQSRATVSPIFVPSIIIEGGSHRGYHDGDRHRW